MPQKSGSRHRHSARRDHTSNQYTNTSSSAVSSGPAPRDYTPNQYTNTSSSAVPSASALSGHTPNRQTNLSSSAGSSGSIPPGYSPVRRTSTSSPAGSSGSASPAERAPTNSSYYSFNGVPWNNRDSNSQTWMYASEARQQQAGAPSHRAIPYPSYYGNHEPLALSTPGTPSPRHRDQRPEWLHHPLTPGRTTTWTDGSGVPKGAVRSIYTANDPTKFDVANHDPSLGTTEGGTDKFGLSNYHAKVPPRRPRGPTR